MVGDGKVYDGYYNAPLTTGDVIVVWFGVIAECDGVSLNIDWLG